MVTNKHNTQSLDLKRNTNHLLFGEAITATSCVNCACMHEHTSYFLLEFSLTQVVVQWSWCVALDDPNAQVVRNALKHDGGLECHGISSVVFESQYDM